MFPRFCLNQENLETKKELSVLHDSTLKTIKLFNEHKTPYKGIFSFGSCGTGKTLCQMEIAKAVICYIEFLKENRQEEITREVWIGNTCRIEKIPATRIPKIIILSFWDLLRNVRTSWSENVGYIPKLINEYDFIFIDDIKIREGNPDSLSRYAWDTMNELIDLIAYAKQGSVLLYLTSNLNTEQLSNIFGDYFMDRIKQLCHIIETKATSFR